MSQRSRSVLTAVVAVAAIAVTTVLVVHDDDAQSSTPMSTETAAPFGVGAPRPKGPATGGVGGVPTRYIGPQGQTGQFVVHCTYSHSGSNDPIVHLGMPGMSHRHDFYGPVTTNASSTPEKLLRAPDTCDKGPDKAAYWQPTLYDHGKAIVPQDLSAYYRAAPGVDPKKVVPYPFGLAMLAGDQMATTPQPGEAAGWTCGSRSEITDVPPICDSSAPLHLVLTFPDCWDGVHADSEDHISHVAYSADGTCPKGYPKHVPQLTLSIRFPVYGDGHELTLASGNIFSAHGDFFNAWEPAGLEREVDHCIRRGAVCDLASNREEEALFSYNH